jgi:carbon-monoxide dehydrogenase medium subunit
LVASRIAYRAVRNRATIGGSVCHADPAADWVPALCALEAECVISGPQGARRLAIEEFVTGAFENALAPGELLRGIRIPRLSSRGRWGYNKLCRKAGEFALAIGAVLDDCERGRFRAVIGATRGRPIIVTDARKVRRSDGTGLDEAPVLRLFDQHGITDRAARRQHIAVLARALDQATGA